MLTANFFMPPERVQLPPSISEESRQPGARQSKANVGIEFEHRLWKVCREAASPKLSKADLLAFVLFTIVALIATTYSFSELFHALGSGVLEQAVRSLMTR